MRSERPSQVRSNVDACSSSNCGCGSPNRGFARRDFLKLTGLAALAAGFNWRSVAGPFTNADFERLVPADKRLDPEWIKSLYERGQPQVWRGSELAHVGMPIGGIGCGQLYLGGDGRLWNWQIFKPNYTTDYANVSAGPHYAKPMEARSTIEQGFAILIRAEGKEVIREVNQRGFSEVTFRGEYPIGRVSYRDPASPITLDLEAFSPFVPLEPDLSGVPATSFQFTVRNVGRTKVEVEIAGWLQNAVCMFDDQPSLGTRRNRVARRDRALFLECSAEPPVSRRRRERRPDILFDGFEGETYTGWTVTGTAFGTGPIESAQLPAYQAVVGSEGKRLVNSHNARQGEDLAKADAHTGTLLSRPFVIERDFITFLIGGGKHPGKTCLNLLVEGELVASVTGHNENRMRPECFDASPWAGRAAQLQILDQVEGSWGNIGIDEIVFTDEVPPSKRLEQLPGYGTMALTLLKLQRGDAGAAVIGEPYNAVSVFRALSERKPAPSVTTRFGQKLVGALGRTLSLKPEEKTTVRFLVSWHFPYYPNPTGEMAAIPDLARLRRHYANGFPSAWGASTYFRRNFDSLAGQTRLWNQTWYDSTLPYWFLDRTFIPINTLATTTCHWFDTGRFYAWEGVDCCPGTCQHVWQYAQAMARIFPQLERDTRERVDFGIAWHPNGAMDYRGENGRSVAHDGFAGTILRVYREHTASPDSSFLKRLWPRVRTSVEFLIAQDKDSNGLLEGEQFNTLDASWFGPMGWISSLYLAALQAAREMALEMGDEAFARRCAAVVEAGRVNLVSQLFNGEYFIHKPDPAHPEATNTNEGCHIDQVFGQSYAWQLGLNRVVPEAECLTALRSLWRYNFTPDVGPYRQNFKTIPGGRWYAMPGEGGLLMCTWPKGGAEKAAGKGNPAFVGYFNECMTGFEYQVAAHMIWEGMVTEGLAITRTIHDRYHASKRNPYNEVECSDHYARAMMSYGVFLAACGYEYHGPKGHLGFVPRMTPENFRSAFTAAEGWGSFNQKRESGAQQHRLELKWGRLRLRTLAFELDGSFTPGNVQVTMAARPIDTRLTLNGRRVEIALASELTLVAGQVLDVSITES